ncbi:DNA ligase 1-like, partial [Actinia tenebrosa]|uniref:DNA ligase 1-like n=1 Tax=Actinia tenebrosa TaxID=6105 RepID=A0A6P8IQX5_ACTTE
MSQKSISAFFRPSTKVQEKNDETKTKAGDEAPEKPKQQTPIKDSKPTALLDSPPVKKSRRKVARVLEDSSDEENDAMDTTTAKQEAKTNGVDRNESESKMNGERENGTQKTINGDKNTDESKATDSPTDDDFIPKRTTARKHMRKRKASSENNTTNKEKPVTATQNDMSDEKSSEEELKTDVSSPVAKKTKTEKDADNKISPKSFKKEKQEMKEKSEEKLKGNKTKSTKDKKSSSDSENGTMEVCSAESDTTMDKKNSSKEEKSTSDSEKDGKKDESKKSAFSKFFFSPRQPSKSSKLKEAKREEATIKTEKKSPKEEKHNTHKNDAGEDHEPVDASEYNPEKNCYNPIKHACWKRGERVPYLAVARTFQAIEETSARLKIMSILSNLLRSVIVLSPNDLLPCVYLCLNKLAPAYEGIELGIGDHILMKAVAESTGRNLQLIKADLAEKGDLGLVAEASRSNQRTMFAPPKLTAVGVFSKLKEISLLTGHSSMSRKVDIIKGMFVACRHSEARYLIRSLGGKLRIGLAEQSVLTALAHAAVLTPPCQEYPPPVLDASKTVSSEELKKKFEEAALIVKSCY